MNAPLNQRPQVLAFGALVIGLIVGLVIGWVIWPVSLSSVAPVDLHTGYRDYYLSMVANEYSVTHDLNLAKTMLGADRDRWSSKDIAVALQNLAKTRANKAQIEALAADVAASAPVAQPSGQRARVEQVQNAQPAHVFPPWRAHPPGARQQFACILDRPQKQDACKEVGLLALDTEMAPDRVGLPLRHHQNDGAAQWLLRQGRQLRPDPRNRRRPYGFEHADTGTGVWLMVYSLWR